MRTVLSISLTEKMAQELNSFAKATGRNKSDILKESLGNYLWEIKFKETKKRLSARAKKAGFITDDDVFKTVS
jgi:metal-responsive CopG/Arc/MetJ family transcriptional regulator